MSDYNLTRDRSLGDEAVNIAICILTLGLVDHEMQKAGAYGDVGEPHVPGDDR